MICPDGRPCWHHSRRGKQWRSQPIGVVGKLQISLQDKKCGSFVVISPPPVLLRDEDELPPLVEDDSDDEGGDEDNDDTSDPPPRRSNRSNRRVPPLRYDDAYAAAVDLMCPTTVKEAIGGDKAEMWAAAMDKELESLWQNKVYIEVTPEASAREEGDRKQVGATHQDGRGGQG